MHVHSLVTVLQGALVKMYSIELTKLTCQIREFCYLTSFIFTFFRVHGFHGYIHLYPYTRTCMHILIHVFLHVLYMYMLD